jgi:hypothetical protein
MSMLRSRVGVAVMQNRLFAIGGYNGQERLNTVEVNNRSFFSFRMLDTGTFIILSFCLGYRNPDFFNSVLEF